MTSSPMATPGTAARERARMTACTPPQRSTRFDVTSKFRAPARPGGNVLNRSCMAPPFLPPHQAVPPARGLEQGAAGAHERTLGTVLLVEDEPTLLWSLAVVLKENGYRVLEAASARAALRLWHAHATEINLLLTDMVLPDDLTGPALAGMLQREQPSLGVVFTSGYSAVQMQDVFQLSGPVTFLQKPCAPAELLATVSRACGHPS